MGDCSWVSSDRSREVHAASSGFVRFSQEARRGLISVGRRPAADISPLDTIIGYHAGSELKAEMFQLQRRAVADRYLHTIAFVTHQHRPFTDGMGAY